MSPRNESPSDNRMIPPDLSLGNIANVVVCVALAFESESSGGVDNNIDLKNHDEEVIENKEVMDLVDFGCGKSGMFMNSNFNKVEISREEYEDTEIIVRDLMLGKIERSSWKLDHIDRPHNTPHSDYALVYLGTRTVENEFITPKSCRSVGCIKNAGIREWPKMEKASHVNFTFNSRLWKFDMWEWLKRKRETHIKFRFCKFNMWEWRKRKKIGRWLRMVIKKIQLFINELNAVGKQRGTGLGYEGDKRKQKSHQLLTEISGFQALRLCLVLLVGVHGFRTGVLHILFSCFLPLDKVDMRKDEVGQFEFDFLVGEIVGGLNCGEDLKFVVRPTKFLMKFHRDGNVNVSRSGVRFRNRKVKLGLVFAELLVDSQQVLMVSVAAGLRGIGYEFEVYSLEDGPAHSIWKTIGVPVNIIEAKDNTGIAIDWLNYDRVLVHSLAVKDVISSLLQEPFISVPLNWTVHEKTLATRAAKIRLKWPS
ncbi:hypothetical protein Tco_1317695 [Tanacetum coccineum]